MGMDCQMCSIYDLILSYHCPIFRMNIVGACVSEWVLFDYALGHGEWMIWLGAAVCGGGKEAHGDDTWGVYC